MIDVLNDLKYNDNVEFIYQRLHLDYMYIWNSSLLSVS